MSANVITKSNIPAPSRLKVAHRALTEALEKPTFFIERAILLFDKVHVTYIKESDLDAGNTTEESWTDASISVERLETYVSQNFGNQSFYNDLTVGVYLDENLHECVKAYLEAGKELLS